MRLCSALVVMLVPLTASGEDFLGTKRETWTSELGDKKSPAVRRSAAFALGKMKADAVESIEPLAAALADEDAGVRDAAAFALGEIADSTSGNARRVWEASGDKLQLILRDKNERVRRSAAYAMGGCGIAAKLVPQEPLNEALKDDSPLVRQNAAWALGRVGLRGDAKAAATALGAALERKDEALVVLRDAAQALKSIGSPHAEVALKSLTDLAEHKDKAVSAIALRTLVGLVGPELSKADADKQVKLVEILQKALRTGDPQLKAEAAGALANLGEKAGEAALELAEILDDKKVSDSGRRNAMVGLTRMTEALKKLERQDLKRVVANLVKVIDVRAEEIQRMSVEARQVRQFAMETLSRVGLPALEFAKDAILKAIESDPDPEVCHCAVWCFLNGQHVKMYGAEKALLVATKHSRHSLRYDAARALANGLQADTPDEVIPVLEQMLTDTSIKIYYQTTAKVKSGSESTGGMLDVTPEVSGDARYMAADSLARVGPKVEKHPSIMKTLDQYKEKETGKLRESSENALKAIKKN